jgi:hypothetical protein
MLCRVIGCLALATGIVGIVLGCINPHARTSAGPRSLSVPFELRTVDPRAVEKLKSIRREFGWRFPNISCGGLHNCSICAASSDGSGTLTESHINLFVAVDHYIETHGYAPPDSFIEAVLAANRHCDAPIYRTAT